MPRVACNHGLEYAFEPAATAFVAIDMQRDFLDAEGYLAAAGDDISSLRAIIPRFAGVLAAAREAGLTVIHTREGYAGDLSDMHDLKRERASAGQPGPLGRFLIRGEAGHDTVPELYPQPGEVVIDKPGFGAFYRTELDAVLADRGITHLVLAGVTTQCCVHSTLRQAVDRGYRCLTLEDCCAAVDPALHEAAISLIYGENHLFGWVATVDDFLETLAPLTC
ncbi:MAG: isochorismatase family cysteine hydrolase [Alphaproteobacteria bacterium]|jgi:nicotinamidase-related amidase|nr:isochorismatase family cysteine hydrolase [Alphaproteobacteria bacterium]